MTSHTIADGCGFSSCTAWGAHRGWVAAATPEGRVEVVRVCDVGGGEDGDVHVVTTKDSSEVATLEHGNFHSLYTCSGHRVGAGWWGTHYSL